MVSDNIQDKLNSFMDKVMKNHADDIVNVTTPPNKIYDPIGYIQWYEGMVEKYDYEPMSDEFREWLHDVADELELDDPRREKYVIDRE